MRVTLLWVINFFIFQWLFIRVCKFVNSDGVVFGFGILFPVIPMTGFWFGYIPKKYKSYKLFAK